MVKGSFILSIDVGGGTRGVLNVLKDEDGFSASFKAGRKMQKAFPLSSLKEYHKKIDKLTIQLTLIARLVGFKLYKREKKYFKET